MATPLTTPRLLLRGWQSDDAPNALEIYRHPDVAQWLSPAMDPVHDLAGMRLLLQQWITEDSLSEPPAGRWAIRRHIDGRVIGGAFLLPLPPGRQDLQIGWQLHPDVWGRGYATETTHALAGSAFTQDVDEVFAVVRPGNIRAEATAHRNGMGWVGITDKYFQMTLIVYRLRPADLDRTTQQNQLPGAPAHEPSWGKDQ